MHRTAIYPLSRPLPKRMLAVAVLCALAMTGCHRSTTLEETKADTRIDSGHDRAAAVAEPQAAATEAAVVSKELDSITVTGSRIKRAEARETAQPVLADGYLSVPAAPPPPPSPTMQMPHGVLPAPELANTEKYESRDDNPVRRASETPVSTFSIDVDTGSYANIRRMLRDGVRPPADAIRAEEMINYFDYGHPGPSSLATPFRVTTELAPAPWNGKRQLLMIGIKGYDVAKAELPPANLVFLIDTSGSMSDENKLPLLKKSFAQLVEQLRPQDRVSMVVYSGSAGLVLEPTPGSEKDKILAALDNLGAGGSTNGGAGIQLAYAMAKQAYMKNGVNRVILATDGDFNVGTTDQKALETLVGDQRKHGIALTTLGFGQGNYNDAMAERLADVGDGNHAYIDTLQEARKVLVQEMQSTLLTIAKDVKIQIEFNPLKVAEYRLIGYENRALRDEDFANDKVDAGDIGAGHEVTALYEITPVDSGAERLPALRYGIPPLVLDGHKTTEMAHLRLRYKRPGEDSSRLIERPVLTTELRTAPSASLRFASAVAAYADGLRGGKHLEQWSWQDIARTARDAKGSDPWQERAEFIELVDSARRITAGDTPQIGMIAD
jgi:Ca-activated chloride channel homolog